MCSESAVCSQESEELKLDLKEQDILKQNGLLKKNSMQEKFSEKDFPKPLFMEILRKLILEQFQALTSLPGDFHVKTLALLEKELEYRGVVLHFGDIIAKPLGYYDQNTQSLKMFRHLQEKDLTLSLEILPKSGMMQNGIVFQLPQLVRYTKGKGYSLWLTPTVVERWSKDKIVITKNGTPRRKYKNGKTSSLGLSQQVQMFPTPTSKDNRGGSKFKFDKHYFVEKNQHGQLNPNWVEWLMGFPIGWTELDVLETQSFLNAQKLSVRQLKKKKEATAVPPTDKSVGIPAREIL